MVLSRKIEDQAGLVRALATDYARADVPEVVRGMFRWIEDFVRCSWTMGPAQIAAARAAGATDSDIVDWAQLGALQTTFLVQADGCGVFFPDEAAIAVGRTREWYANAAEEKTAVRTESNPAETRIRSARASGSSLETNTESETYRVVAESARKRWGTVPNLLRATSAGRSPSLLPRQMETLVLLESPQSESLSTRAHSLVRALVSAIHQSCYCEPTLRSQIERNGITEQEIVQLRSDFRALKLDPAERAVIDLAEKATRHAYKIVERDLESFHEAGLDDAAYVDVLFTVALQMGVDRIANSLRIKPDDQPLLAS